MRGRKMEERQTEIEEERKGRRRALMKHLKQGP
jgi:hypothetical protein